VSRTATLANAASILLAVLMVAAGCSSGEEQSTPSTNTTEAANASTTESTTQPTTEPPTSDPTENEPSVYFTAIPAGGELPDEEACAELVRAEASQEVRPENDELNTVTGGPSVDIDGADEFWNDALAPRITGNFAGTTEQILRWGACKWGFDEDITRARAFTESTWVADKTGDDTDDPALCELIDKTAPCPQSFGLLQVKSTVHTGTFPTVTESSAYGVDYAMAWLRACYEGSFTWLDDERYAAGDELGCAGVWFSGEWFDQPANDYVGEVRFHLEKRSWEDLAS
jgi:hypothetical protein